MFPIKSTNFLFFFYNLQHRVYYAFAYNCICHMHIADMKMRCVIVQTCVTKQETMLDETLNKQI